MFKKKGKKWTLFRKKKSSSETESEQNSDGRPHVSCPLTPVKNSVFLSPNSNLSHSKISSPGRSNHPKQGHASTLSGNNFFKH